MAVLVMQDSVIHRWNQKNMRKNIFVGAISSNVSETITAIFQNGRHFNTINIITFKTRPLNPSIHPINLIQFKEIYHLVYCTPTSQIKYGGKQNGRKNYKQLYCCTITPKAKINMINFVQ